MLTTITIYDLDRQPVRVTVKQDGEFAIHRANPQAGDDPLGPFAVSHVRTGWALIFTPTLPDAQEALDLFRETGIDWSRPDIAYYRQKKHRRIGRSIISLLQREGKAIVWKRHP